GPEPFVRRGTSDTRAALIVHSLGQACQIESIVQAARERGVKGVGDCSQAPAAKGGGGLRGAVGGPAGFSTIDRQGPLNGAAGGRVYSRDVEVFRRALAHADRGKPRWQPDFDDRDPNTFLFPALNHHSDEISCGVGLASLSRLHETIVRRLSFVTELTARLL